MSANPYPQGVPRNAWYIHLESGIMHAEGIVPPVPAVSRGESATYTFRMYTSYYKGDDPPAEPTHRDRYEALLALDEHAGSYVDKRTPTNDVLYHEQLPGGADSLLVKLEPAYETGARGVWGLLNGVSDGTTMETELVDIEIDIMKVADADAYESRAECESALSYGGP